MPKIIDGDEHGTNSAEELVPGRWVNGEPLDPDVNAKIERDLAAARQKRKKATP